MEQKEKIRPLYSELQGCFSQAPEELPGAGKMINTVSDDILDYVNHVIDELNKVSNEDYNRYKLRTKGWTHSLLYRTKLSGLISSLHGQYFSEEPAPFSGMPSTVISQTQQQSQSIHIQMLLDFQAKIDAQLKKLVSGDKKRTFLEKVKGALASVKDYAGLITLWITTARECGLTLEELLELMK